MLLSQVVSLDTIFTDMARRAALNNGQYPDATERYLRLAFKAQSNSWATLEALAKLHQPREQTVRHVHVDNRGGQAVIADTVNTGGSAERKRRRTSPCNRSPWLQPPAAWLGPARGENVSHQP